MTFEDFEQRAWEEWERIPEEYRAGIDGLVIERSALPHPSLRDIFTLGECRTESYPSPFGGPDTTRSVVVLYYGSFFRLSRLDAGFDWAGELWETLTHELQHHLESLVDDDALGDMDYAADENYKRYQGEAFDPFFFRHGIDEDGWRRVDDEYFLEVSGLDGPVTFVWADITYAVNMPPTSADVTFLTITDGVGDAPAALHIVIVAAGWRHALRSLFRPRPARVLELDAVARRVPADQDRDVR
ncbi:hypothetical protein BH23GEM9_BH23GEM9_21420 [soil metagenome]